MTIFEAPPGLYVVTLWGKYEWVFFKPHWNAKDETVEGFSPCPDGGHWVNHTLNNNAPCRKLEVKP